LAAPDVFYFGLAAGECGDSTANAYVDGTDLAYARDNAHNVLNRAAVDDPGDFNRDSFVDGSDLVIVRDNSTNVLSDLNLITVPAAPEPPGNAHPALLPIDLHVGIYEPMSEDEYECQFAYAEPYERALVEGALWEPGDLEALLANAIWAYEMEGMRSDSNEDDPINEAAADDIFALYHGE